MRVQVITNPNKINDYSRYDTIKDNTLPEVSSSLKPIDRNSSNLEAEKDEVVTNPDLSSAYKILGKPHSQGGTPLKLPQNSFIFSKDKSLAISKKEQELFGFKLGGSVKKEDNTPAKILLRQVDIKHHNQMNAVLNDVKNRDMVAKNTAEMMLKKNKEKFGQVAYLQESKKDFINGVPAFSENTQPIYSQNIKDNVITEKQYMQDGGFFNNFKPLKRNSPNVNPNDRFNNFFNFNPNSKFIPRTTPFDKNNLPYGYNDKNYLSNLVGSLNDTTGNSYETSPLGLNTMRKDQYKQYPEFIQAAGDLGYWNRNATDNREYQDDRASYDAIGIDKNVPTFNNEQEKIDYFNKNKIKPLNTKYGNNLGYKVDPTTGRFIGVKYNINNIPNINTRSTPNVNLPNVPLNNSLQAEEPILGGQFTNQKVPFNTGQIASLAGTALINGMRKNFFPQRVENSFVPIELEKLNPNSALQENTNNWLQAARIAATMGTTPQTSSFLQKATQEGISNANKIRDQYDTNNVGIGNKQNEYNNNGFNLVRNQNVANNNNYYNQVITTLGRSNQEKINGTTDLLNKGLGYYGENLQMQHALNAMQQYPVLNEDGTPKLDPKTGKQIYNTPYSIDNNGSYKFNNVNGFNGLINGEGNNQQQLQLTNLYKQLDDIKNDNSPAAYNLRGNLNKSIVYLLKTGNKSRYGGYIKRK